MLSTRVSEASLALLQSERKKLIAEYGIQESKFPEEVIEYVQLMSSSPFPIPSPFYSFWLPFS